MFLKRLFKILGLFCFFCLLSTIFLFHYHKYKDRQKHTFIISENKDRNALYSNVPYLEIPDYHIKRIIQPDASMKNLNDGYVVIWNQEKDFHKIGNIILAGHNIQNVFKDLPKVKRGTKVYLYDKSDLYIFEIVSKKIIHVTEDAYLEDLPYKQLSLITCTRDNQQRLLLIGSYIEKKNL